MNMKTAVEQDVPGREEIPAAAAPLQAAERRDSTERKEEATELPAALLPDPLRREAVRETGITGETEVLIPDI